MIHRLHVYHVVVSILKQWSLNRSICVCSVTVEFIKGGIYPYIANYILCEVRNVMFTSVHITKNYV